MEYFEKVAAYEDAIMEKIANASSSSVKNNDEDEEAFDEGTSKAMILGGGAIGGGALALKSQFQNGNLTGRETLYHQTGRSNVESIKKHGVKASFSQDPNNVTHMAAIGRAYAAQGKKLPEYTYFGRKKILLATPKYQSAIEKGDTLGALREQYINRKHIKVKAPVWKMKSVQNPETAGIDPKSPKRGRKLILRGGGMTFPFLDDNYNRMFDDLNKKTVTIDGDMPPEYVKGGKKYRRATKQEVVDYIKNNRKRFAKGAAIAAAGITASTAGAAYIAHQLKKKKKAQKKKVQKEENEQE